MRDIDRENRNKSIEEKLRKLEQLEAMAKRIDGVINILEEIEFNIDNVLEFDRCHACNRYTLKPESAGDKTVLRCGNCGLSVEIPEEML